MRETGQLYPAYVNNRDEKLLESKVLMSLDYEQILEIANVFYFVNMMAERPAWRGGIKLDEARRALHKSVHDASVNCCLSLEEKARVDGKDGMQ